MKSRSCPAHDSRCATSHSRFSLAFILFITQVVLAALALTAHAASTAPGECILIERQGKVEFAPQGTSAWAMAKTNQVLKAGDRLRTGLRARATLRWSELSVVRVDELTTMEVHPPAKPGAKAEMELKSGASYFFSREKPEDINFRTPVASGAIRGTEFTLRVAEDGQTEVALVHGEVLLANAQGETTLKSGELGKVEQGKAPTKSPLLDAVNVIQWVLNYPAVVDPNDLRFTQQQTNDLFASVMAYKAGDLRGALEKYPEARPLDSESERLWYATLLLSVGQAAQAEAQLTNMPASLVGNALKELIATVKGEKLAKLNPPQTASEWMARSYQLQSRRDLVGARDAAAKATKMSPDFGAAWIRLAELEFGFGHTDKAQEALMNGTFLSPRNANGLVISGFISAALDANTSALDQFNQAIALDGSLPNAWLGRGLVKIRSDDHFFKSAPGRYQSGLDDLQVAAALAPQSAVYRSYLGKGFSEAHDLKRARKELDLAREMDPNDPTSWLYSALLNQTDNRVNEAVSDLEQSKELNDNRSLFRSEMMLDQDQAVRSANLAAMYRDVGMFDRSVQEASRAVESDYANYSAHLFLANSYDSLRDPNSINLRYETAWFSELLVANLLAPPGGGSLSQNISQQEYSRFFVTDGVGIFSQTEYQSSGAWVENASAYGLFGKTGFAFDTSYRTDNGQRPNNDIEQLNLTLRLKHQVSAQDSVFFQVGYMDMKSGDVAQYYDQASASSTVRVEETQEPSIVAGWHHEWSPENHTLILVARFDDTLTIADTDPNLLWLRNSAFLPPPTNVVVGPAFFSRDYESQLTAYSAELQHIWQGDQLSLIGGARYQTATADTTDDVQRNLGTPIQILQVNETDLSRASVYGYGNYDILDSLRLIAGVSYDRLDYPVNIDTSPISSGEDDKDLVSPKAGFVLSPLEKTHLRGLYSRSLGGVFFDNSIRLEPATLAGFNQAYRSLIPESVQGLVSGTEFETFSLGADQAFATRTYFNVTAELLKSEGERTLGILENSDPIVTIPDTASSTRQSLDYEERALTVALTQLLGEQWATGARYKFTDADMVTRSLDISPTVPGAAALNQDVNAQLHQVWLYGIFQHRCGFFAQVDGVFSDQTNDGYTPALAGDSFWQFNAFVGYRFLQRRGEIRVGLLNITDEDYQLNPLTLYNELPREQTLTVSLKLDF
jgi:tetratricopeptide (TPR) repeat protein